MAIDIANEINNTRNAYTRLRGATPRTGKKRPDGKAWMAFGSVPNTTWSDVILAYAHINRYIDPDPQQCVKLLMKHEGLDLVKAQTRCMSFQRGVNPRSFVRTPGFKTAKANFNSVSPVKKSNTLFISPAKMKEVYPFNEEFWGAAQSYAVERGAAGMVPYWTEIAMESLIEAIKELPENLGKLVPEFPDYSWIADIIKWGSIGGGLFILYWYVLKPKDKRRTA